MTGFAPSSPLSTTPPARSVAYVVELTLTNPPPDPFDAKTVWAKCDMVATVGFGRLDQFRGPRHPNGKRTYVSIRLPEADLERLRRGVLAGLGLAT